MLILSVANIRGPYIKAVSQFLILRQILEKCKETNVVTRR